jgi:DNA polymerase-3 subunit delta
MRIEPEDALEEVREGKEAAFYLVWGEEYLARKAADELVKALLPPDLMSLNYSVLDAAGPREIAQDLATIPLFPGRKVVLVRDPEFLAPEKGRGDPLKRARDAWKSGKQQEGARRLLALAARAGWSLRKIDPRSPSAASVEEWKEELNVDLAQADIAFLREVADYCREQNVSAPESDVQPLAELLDRGLSKGQILVVVATEVDPKNPLIKLALEKGRVIERKVAGRLKDLDLAEIVSSSLTPFQKKMSRAAEEALKDRCGGNMRLLQSELEKLALYVETPVIEAKDVALLVSHARDEEFLELSDALQKRDWVAALKYVEDALEQGAPPLLLLGAVGSIVRTLLLNHDRLNRLSGGVVPRSFDQFNSRILPKIQREAEAEKQRLGHPYAIFMGIQAAARYTRKELLDALAACAEADLALKSSGNGRLVIERLLWGTCQRAPQEQLGQSRVDSPGGRR